MTYDPLTKDERERDWHIAVADFLAELDALHAVRPEITNRTLRYIGDEVLRGRWRILSGSDYRAVR